MQLGPLEIKRSAPRLKLTGVSNFEQRTRENAAVQAAAPNLPMIKRDAGITDILPPFGTNPPTGPVTTALGDLTSRQVSTDPRELWYLALPSKLTPKMVLQILRSALGGDIWQQWQLLSLMLDTWPMFRKCCHELSEAVSYTRFVARPYCLPGQEPDDDAKQKADLVARAMAGFNPNPFTDEKNFTGMIYNITDAMLNGLMLEELIWNEPTPAPKDGGRWEQLPRAAAWVHPRHFTFTNDGLIAVFDSNYKRLLFENAFAGKSPNPNKFLCGQFMSKSGSALGAGLMRPLAWYWSAVVFNREWMLTTAQNFGAPFLDITYRPGTPQPELNKLDEMLINASAQRFLRHPEGTTAQIHPAQSLGSENPQRFLMEEADKACMFLLLGQEGTTKATPGKLGGEDEKSKVKRERVEGLAKWVGTDVLAQFARAVCRVNYPGEVDQIPTVEPDFTEATDPVALVQLVTALLTAKVPLAAKEFYEKLRMTMPDVGDQVVVGGELGFLGDMKEDLGQPPPLPEPGAPEDNNFMPGGDGEQPMATSVPIRHVKRALQWATPEDLKELESLAVAAHEAPHANGEVTALRGKLNQIMSKGRR